MKNEIIKFSITDLAITELATKYQDMKIIDAQSYKLVTAGIGEIRSIRVSVEKRRKELKADALEYGRRLDTEAKRITELLLPIENDLKATRQAEDARKKAIQDEKDRLEKERVESIKAKIASFPPDMSRLPQLLKMSAPEIQEMQDALTAIEIDIEDYQEFIPEAIKTKEEKRKLLQEYYIARITADAEAAKQKAEVEQQEQIRIEQARKQKIEQDRLDKIQEAQIAEQKRMEAEKRAIKEEQDRLENERLERERIEQERLSQIERDRLAKIEAEKQEKARIEQEAKEEAERKKLQTEEKKYQETLRPDKETLRFYLSAIQESFMAIEEPLMKRPSGNITLTQIQAEFEKTFNDILDIIEDM